LNAPKAHGSSDSDLFRDLWYYAVLFEFVIVDGARASKVRSNLLGESSILITIS
jgi:hypothetical protein